MHSIKIPKKLQKNSENMYLQTSIILKITMIETPNFYISIIKKSNHYSIIMIDNDIMTSLEYQFGLIFY